MSSKANVPARSETSGVGARFASRMAAVGVCVLTFGGMVSGCANIPGESIRSAIEGSLSTFEDSGEASVDFDELIAGSWERLLIVCFDVSNGDLDRALGFAWEAAPRTSAENFVSMLVFATDSTVEKFYRVGENEFAGDWYFTPCTTPAGGGGALNEVIVVPRPASEIRFVFDQSIDGHPYWYVPLDQMQDLSSRFKKSA